MMHRAAKKLNNRAGETIAETLVALLIAALALVMLAGAITAASHMVTNSRNRINDYYDANEEDTGVVKMKSSTETVTVGIGSTPGAADIAEGTDAYVYRNRTFENKQIVAYRKK